MRICGAEIVIRTTRKLCKISANLQCTCRQQSVVALSRLHDEISVYLYSIGVVLHSECTGACCIIPTIKSLNTVITLHIQLASVHKHITAGLNKISSYGQLVSVEVKSSS